MKIFFKTIITFSILLIINFNLSYSKNNIKPVKQIKVENGIIEGWYDTEKGLNIFLGIPYAKPPLGELRWKAPQPLDNWVGIKSTKRFGNRPWQHNVYGDMIYRSDTVSEDCLYLNIWVSANQNKRKLPVLVYIYGGGFKAGDGSEPRYDGAGMAQKGIIVVTINYRLNVFGFLALPELSAESPYKASGNYGLLDQNAALKWVSKNISKFGGDPKKITIAGESAGSISVSVQMASPLSKSLIAGAIGESGAALNPTREPVSLPEAEKIGLEFVKIAGNPNLQQLRKMSANELYEIFKAQKDFKFPLVIDGYFLPKSLPEIFSAGEQANVPIIVGWNSAEISSTSLMNDLPYTEENFINRIKEVYPDDYEGVLKLYPHSSIKEIEYSATTLASDRFIAFSTWKWFDMQHNKVDKPVYRYLFCKIRPGVVASKLMNSSDSAKKQLPLGAAHATEIEYCMGNLYLIKIYNWTSNDYKVSETMQNYFANFIKSGNPNGLGLPEWTDVKAENPNHPVMIIDVESKLVNAANEERYMLLDNIYKKK
jgi:para-nitrobenzyl esterase